MFVKSYLILISSWLNLSNFLIAAFIKHSQTQGINAKQVCCLSCSLRLKTSSGFYLILFFYIFCKQANVILKSMSRLASCLIPHLQPDCASRSALLLWLFDWMVNQHNSMWNQKEEEEEDEEGRQCLHYSPQKCLDLASKALWKPALISEPLK